nr:MAG TPA: hypothetical protein [Caudoviricetes sp.]
MNPPHLTTWGFLYQYIHHYHFAKLAHANIAI